MKKKELRIKVFGAGWWFYVVLTLTGLFLLSCFGNRIPSEEGRYKLVLYLSIIELIILRLYKFSLKDIREDYNYFNELPCYLCNQATLLCILAAIIHDRGIMAYCVSIGTLGALLALLMPDRYNRDQLFFSKQAFGFYGYHGLLIISCLSFYVLHLYDPEPLDALYPMLYTFLLAVLAHAINLILIKTGLNPKSNYVFTCYPDNVIMQKLHDLWPVRLFYMLPILPVFGLYSLILFLIL